MLLEVGQGKEQLFGAGVFGDSLGALGHGVFGQFPRQQQADRGLDLPGGDGGAFVIMSQAGGFPCNALKYIVDKGIHNTHGLGGNTGVGVHLLQHLVHVNGVTFLPALSTLLPIFLWGFSHRFLGSLLRGWRGLCWFRHFQQNSLFCLYTLYPNSIADHFYSPPMQTRQLCL
ncbi:hypothetical protein XELAEV_18026399mg [Xenopus laevis]|uniref:Uncharacterized protein n=1 Tax=Xenopus laevis TaxID=8355 RepID=A0A974HJB2_XENLA|nr:hypothetical protein XELAEV_18026399mg [Xenopus laevis]